MKVTRFSRTFTKMYILRYVMDTPKIIYLDYASTHPRRDEIISARTEFEKNSYANV